MTENVGTDMAALRRRVIYRACHRGTREMDFLLGKFAKACVEEMNSKELEDFETLMAFPDPMLQTALIDGSRGGSGEFDREEGVLLARIRAFHKR